MKITIKENNNTMMHNMYLQLMQIVKVNPEVSPKEQLASRLNNSIFLAGPCPRKDYTNDWRYKAFDILNRLGFKGNVITPTNDRFQELRDKYGKESLRFQTEWETIAMKKASAIVFWVDRHIDAGFPAFTTNIEFGDWYNKPGVFCGFPDDADKNDYLKVRLEQEKIPYWNDLETMLSAVVERLNRPSGKFFTSDTHFSQQRTLELSRRPFVDVDNMDLEMISNWNKTVTMNDEVYHAGDFGDISTMRDIVSCLNFKTLHFVLGNYDRKILPEIEQALSGMGRDIILSSAEEFDEGGKHYYVVHEPDEGTETPKYPDNIVLYGHIHGRAFAKKNGFDLATDYHRYTPISMEQVAWFANAIQYWDHNVFCEEASVYGV